MSGNSEINKALSDARRERLKRGLGLGCEKCGSSLEVDDLRRGFVPDVVVKVWGEGRAYIYCRQCVTNFQLPYSYDILGRGGLGVIDPWHTDK